MGNTISNAITDAAVATAWIASIFDNSGNLKSDTTITLNGCHLSVNFYTNEMNLIGIGNKTLAQAISATTSLTFESGNSLDSGLISTSGVFYNSNNSANSAAFNALTNLDLSGLNTNTSDMGNCTFQYVQFPVLTSINWSTKLMRILNGTFHTTQFGALTSLDFSASGVTSISAAAFNTTTFSVMTSINFGNSLLNVSANVFANADLSKVQQLIIGSAMGPIGQDAFTNTIFTNLQCVMNGSNQIVDLSQISSNTTLNHSILYQTCVGSCSPTYTQSTYSFAVNGSATINAPIGQFCGNLGLPEAPTSLCPPGALPPGMSLNNDGSITGTPTTPGQYNVTITITTQ